eukprot:5186253-Prymnesium_polylepis.2
MVWAGRPRSPWRIVWAGRPRNSWRIVWAGRPRSPWRIVWAGRPRSPWVESQQRTRSIADASMRWRSVRSERSSTRHGPS